jgi:hypothetical protein
MYFPSVSCVRFITSGRISSFIADYIMKQKVRIRNLNANYHQISLSNISVRERH